MIINSTKRFVVSKNHKIYRGIWQAKGLMFSSKKAAVFPFPKPKRASIHTLFVFYPIDLLFLDYNKKVVEKKDNLGPFSSYSSKKEASLLIELPSDSGKAVSIGDTITFK